MARFRGSSNWQKLQPLPLILDRGHYYARRKPAKSLQWPKERMKDDAEVPCSQEYETNGADQVLRGGVKAAMVSKNQMIAPKKKISQPKDDDDWLRTCSSMRSSATSTLSSKVVRRGGASS